MQLSTQKEIADYYRGFLLKHFVLLEKFIEQNITNFFIDNSQSKKILLRSVLLDRMTFEAKRTSLRHLFSMNDEKNGFIKTKNNTYPSSFIFNELRELNDIRNYCAHYYSMTPINDNVVICLVEFRDSPTVYEYTVSDINDIIERMDSITLEIVKYISKIIERDGAL
jgi:hypothetical protein